MSWMKRRGQPSPNPTPPGVTMYNPNQHSNQQSYQHQQWQPQQQYDPNNWYNQPKQNSTSPSQTYQNPPNFWQPTNYPNQNYTNPMMPNQYDQYNHQNYYPNTSYDYQQQYQQNYYQQQSLHAPNVEKKEQNESDPWNWGWDDNNSNQNQNLNQNQPNQNQPNQTQPNQNSQNVSESFANDETWNWTVDDNQKNQEQVKETKPPEKYQETDNTEHLQHAAVSRIKNETLTPQWSIESQVSQDSSDDVLLTSESDNRSKLSRSSTISQSPTTPASNDNTESVTNRVENVEVFENSIERIEQSMQELVLGAENKEIISPETKNEPPKEYTPPPPRNPQENFTPPPKNISQENLIKEPTPPPRLPPLTSDSNKNPYKRTLNRKVPKDTEIYPNQVNLETLPDNSERPDQDPVKVVRKSSVQQQWAENCEIAPINDRNQYLETGQLSDAEVYQYDNTQNTENTDSLPPPGLRRLVLGQLEQETTPIVDNTDEPPPGLSRMVLGHTEPVEQPLHRMVPGESSSPESYNNRSTVFQPYEDDNSESELIMPVVSRSATIGADTPPVTQQNFVSEPLRVGAVGIDSEPRDTDVDGANTLDESIPSASSIPPDSRTPKQNEQNDKRKPRSYGTDSDEQKDRRSPRYEKDRRYYDERRDSPDYRRHDRRDRRHDERKYDDDTDYYSDKERERRHREERDDYEKRYGSLRRDKDKRDRRRDYDDRERRRDDYYYRYEDDYYRDSNRSRPSSRSDSVHDSYRERSHRHRDDRDMDRNSRHRDRDRDKDHRRMRDPYNQYYQGYRNYDPYNPYYQQYQQYQYYENLRRTNPQAYAEWYRKYYQSQGVATYNAEDRASVHSGRSSANGDLSKDRYTRQSYYCQQYPNYYREIENASTVYTVDDSRLLDNTDSSLNLEDTVLQSQRLTPAKYTTAHVKASISSGHLLNILPHYPADGQPAIVEVISIHGLLADLPETKELTEFPGPLIKGITHKKTVIDYCENKIRKADRTMQDVDSYVLMWELLILLLRQNGMVVGTDIAELLMKNRPSNSRSHSISSNSSEHDHKIQQYSDEYVTDRFREYLIYGSGKEALEWAMKHGLWGHALFLASKLDKRTYANVMMRFANGLTMNDPLQTLYQLLSGRQPAAVTCVADEKWGNWRPHLAMILSNTTQRPELDRKAITTLGDTLFNRGSIYAAHFCYLMAQVEFGRYGSGKLVLLGANQNRPYEIFASNEAIFMTEIYEYACSLSDASFSIPEFLTFKFLIATRLVDHGLLEKGLQYLERTADGIIRYPSRVQASLVSRVCELSDRLKYCDPLQAEDLDSNRADATWLSNLKTILNDFNMGLITHESLRNLACSEPELSQEPKTVTNDQTYEPWQQPIENYYQQGDQNVDYTQQQQVYQPEPVPRQEEVTQEQYWNQQPQLWEEPQPTVDEQQTYWNQPTEEQSPAITLPNQSMKSYGEEVEEDKPVAHSSPVVAKPKPAQAQPAKQTSTGWFGGIWNKLSFRPNNQMKLPDDKNPTIVWDSEKKRWVNLEADGDEAAAELKPPPKMSEIPNRNFTPSSVHNNGAVPLPQMNSGPTSLPYVTNQLNSLPPTGQSSGPISLPTESAEIKESGDTPKLPSQGNIFKIQRRGRNIKNAYVDVFNPGGVKTTTENIPSAEEVFGALPSAGAQMNYFVPAPISDPNAPADFLTPVPTNAQQPGDENAQVQPGPMMFNPNDFSNNQRRTRNH